MQRRIILIISALAFLGLVVLMIILAVIGNRDKSQDYLEDAVSITLDKDTGETAVIDDPNLSDQGVEDKGVVIFGLEELADEGVLRVQLTYIKDSIAEYARTRLSGAFESVTLRPQDLTAKNGVYTSTLRLGQTEELMPITITADFTGKTQVVIDDPDNKYGGKYTSVAIVFTAD